jgi:hypothetical protein
MPADFAEFENNTDKNINLHLDWDNGSASFNTTIKAGEVASVSGFNGGTARICHRSDGGMYTNCPANSPVAKAGDYFFLEEGGGFSG